jgi:hypothetical protein
MKPLFVPHRLAWILGLAVALPANAQEQRGRTDNGASQSFTLQTGVVVDRARQVVYIMNDPRGVHAVDVVSGRVLWRSRTATAPLLSRRDRLLALAASAPGEHGLRLVLLDASRGKLIKTLPPIALPDWVSPTVGSGLGSQFGIQAAGRGDTAFVAWHATTHYVGGAYLRNPAPGKDEHGTVEVDLASGSLLPRLDEAPLDSLPVSRDGNGGYSFGPFAVSGTEATVLVEQTSTDRKVILRRTRDSSPSSDTVLEAVAIPGQALNMFAQMSADRRHLLVVEQLPTSKGRVPYRLTVFTTDRGVRVGSFVQTDVPGPFIVFGSRLLSYFWSTEPRRVTDLRSQVQVRAIDLASGKVLFTHRVRDLRYHGSYPP